MELSNKKINDLVKNNYITNLNLRIMKKRFFAMYALVGALVASPIFTSCVDDTVSESVEALRNAKVEVLKSEAAYNKAMADAELVKANAEAALNNAKAALETAKAAIKEAKAEKERIEAEKALATAEADLEAAKLGAEKALLEAEKSFLVAQADYEKAVEGLANEAKIKADKLNGNIKAILQGGYYYGLNKDGNWSNIRYYSPSYNSFNDFTSINGLISGLTNENVNLIKLQNNLVDLNEYLAEEKKDNDEIISVKTALIEKYKELQTSSSREDLTKEYEATKEALIELEALQAENEVNQNKAETALDQFIAASMDHDPIVELQDYKPQYFTEKEQEKITENVPCVDGSYYEYSYDWKPVYEHTADNAKTLANEISDLEGEIETIEGNIDDYKTDIEGTEADFENAKTENQRELAIEEANLAKLQKEYDDVIASEGYKAALKTLTDAVTAAKAAFDKTPTTELKDALTAAEAALEAFDYNYGTETEPKYLSNLENDLDSKKSDVDNLKEATYGYYEDELDRLNGLLKGANDDLEEKTKDLEELKGYQAMLAADSKEMKAYLALCAERAKLEEAWFATEIERLTLESDNQYWTGLQTTLEGFIGTETTTGSLPDYEELIAECEDAIKDAEKANKELAELAIKPAEYKYVIYDSYDEYGNFIGTTGRWETVVPEMNKKAQEALIAKKEAEIEKMEAELEIRQAEYDAEVAALKAFIGAEEETPAE